MITGQEVEDYVFERVRLLDLGINGKVYKHGTRPIDSKKEDCVVTFLTGTTGQIQQVEAVVNIYVPDIKVKNGLYMRDIARCKQVEQRLKSVCDDLDSQAMQCELSGAIVTIEEPSIKQHFVSLKLRFYHFNF